MTLSRFDYFRTQLSHHTAEAYGVGKLLDIPDQKPVTDPEELFVFEQLQMIKLSSCDICECELCVS